MDAPLVEGVRARDPRAIARAISLLENREPGADGLVTVLRAVPRRAFVIGVTGAPGVGKSTLIDRLIASFREAGQTVGVLAIDPTSPYTGGAVMGDRVRMQGHALDAGVFIRSMATRGHLGGLAAATADAADVLNAAGFDVILIETVGVGQGEIDIVRAADVAVVVVAPGAGDEVQALKAGVMEIGDIFVVNKADRDGADQSAAAIEAIERMRPAVRPGGWHPPVVKTVAAKGEGVTELVDALRRFRAAVGPGATWRVPGRGEVVDTGLIDHIGIAVDDALALGRFLEETVGALTGATEDVPSQGVRVRFVETGDTRVEILESTQPDGPVGRFLARRGPGLHHLAIRVGDLDATLSALRSRGVRLIDETPRAGAHGARIAFVHPASTGGALIELIEKPGGRADR
jgi:LAO/AO transport system kinase